MRRLLLLPILAACSAPEPTSVTTDEATAPPVAQVPPPTTNAPPPPPTGLPELPAVRRDVLNFGDNGGGPDFTYPHLPPFRLTTDGRIGVILGQRKMYLMSPEMMSGRFLSGPNGVSITSLAHQHTALPAFENSTMPMKRVQMHTICDGTRDQPVSKRRNPYPCAANNQQDCYDLTIVSTVEGEVSPGVKNMEIWGADIRVVVDQPKTANPQISSVTALSPPVSTPQLAIKSLWEPITTEDGYLFVGRASFSQMPNPTGGTGSYDIVYSVYPETATNSPCDVTQWTTFQPISHAPYDPAMQGRYGLAQHPFRDPEGNLIPDGAELKATYQWMDAKGRNLFFTTLNERFHYYDQGGNLFTRYKARCLPGYNCLLYPSHTQVEDKTVEATFHYQGVAMAGLWTHGKVVTVDGVLNNIDYNLYVGKDMRRQVQLYQDNSGPTGAPTSGWIDAGNGRADGNHDPTGHLERPPVGSGNINVIDSIENRFNYSANLEVASPRDVVWLVSNGKGTQEVEFDDYIDKDALIVSNMTASLSHAAPHPRSFGTMRYRDGFAQTRISGTLYGLGPIDEVRFQNGASSPTINVPSYGLADPNVRVEPVALGGVEGKGAWLDGVSGIRYTIPAESAGQQSLAKRDWYLGVFVDARQTIGAYVPELLALPDGSSIFLYYADAVVLRSATGALFLHYLPAAARYAPKHYNHLGFVVRDEGRTVDLYLNGFLLGTSTDTAPILGVVPGDLVVGRDTEVLGFRGWIDELKVIGRRPGPELACNYARGYLVGMRGDADPNAARAAAYPKSSHTQIANLLGTDEFDTYYCVHDYDDVHGMPPALSATSLAAGTRRISAELHFPEGPFSHNAPRPDTTGNDFCLGCHDATRAPPLGLGALTAGAGPMINDPRRQPLFAPRIQSGNFPADFLAPGQPMNHTTLFNGASFFDPFLFP
ncbi:MAG: hypothetical protein RMA76_26250 [Deltaproteobacteria bacterium]